MLNPARSNDNSLPDLGNQPQDVSSHGAQFPISQSDSNSWQTVHLPGTIAADQLSGPTTHSRTNAMDSSPQTNSTSPSTQTSTTEQPRQRETELLNLVRDLNECNDVLLAKVSQLEESLERSQAALQAEIDRSGPPVGDREIVQLVTELEQSNQALQHHQMRSETLQTEFISLRERTTQLEADHTELLQRHTEQSQELLQANTNCRDLRARLQRQQRYTLQFKAALEKCLSMSTDSSNTSIASLNTPGITMPTVDEIRPWESALGNTRLDPQLESMIRGEQTNGQTSVSSSAPLNTLEIEAEDKLWHDLARVMDPSEVPLTESDLQEQLPEGNSTLDDSSSTQFTEPSPWGKDIVTYSPDDDTHETSEGKSQLSPEAIEILERVQSARALATTDTYLPAMSAQGSPSPLVNPLKPQKRIGSLSAIDLPNFPRLKKQTPQAKA